LTTALIVGTGPAAAGAALALSRTERAITVVDIGLQLETERQHSVAVLAGTDQLQWDRQSLESVAQQPARSRTRGVPEKRSYGSDYPFRDIGQLHGLSGSADVTTALISPAYGGFSTVWGSQLMPFSAAGFDGWPTSAAEMRSHYKAVLDEIPHAAERDDLEARFALMKPSAPLPPLAARSANILDAYRRNRSRLNRRGITMGKARLAFAADSCVSCGLCMSGCPYGLIYSSSQTFDTLRRSGRITHHTGLVALRVAERGDVAVVTAREVRSGRIRTFEADRAYVACGAVGTTRLVAQSRGLYDTEIRMLESQQFILPTLSSGATPDPRDDPGFTLNQINMVVELGNGPSDVSMLHFYTYNPAFLDALPRALDGPRAGVLREAILRRLAVVFGYLPSWRSPQLVLRVRPPVDADELAPVVVFRDRPPPGRNGGLRTVLGSLCRSSRMLDLYPVLPMLRLAAGGKSYHWGGTFPHSSDRTAILGTDRLGRVGPWQRVHLVDGAVFPTVPAMTFTFTVMANAHRIATETLGLGS
jgi:choline dehydrogenase-like flavoprotein